MVSGSCSTQLTSGLKFYFELSVISNYREVEIELSYPKMIITCVSYFDIKISFAGCVKETSHTDVSVAHQNIC